MKSKTKKKDVIEVLSSSPKAPHSIRELVNLTGLTKRQVYRQIKSLLRNELISKIAWATNEDYWRESQYCPILFTGGKGHKTYLYIFGKDNKEFWETVYDEEINKYVQGVDKREKRDFNIFVKDMYVFFAFLKRIDTPSDKNGKSKKLSPRPATLQNWICDRYQYYRKHQCDKSKERRKLFWKLLKESVAIKSKKQDSSNAQQYPHPDDV